MPMDRMHRHAVVVHISCIAYEKTFRTIVPYITIPKNMADGMIIMQSGS